ncbi:protein PIGBOS1 [Bufo bufo]|uniref:protein PIGBOS1 n=1 Tax=Bufo bufo TaxID=8384 RepID=UPI001ABEA454|nr:protein PIGBOS1 [Bufo bufo]
MMHRLPFGQLFLAVLLGFAGGVYIYKPLLQQVMHEKRAVEADITATDTAEKGKE